MERGVPCVANHDVYKAPVHINVGGTTYTSTLETLTSYPDSKIAKLFNGTLPIVLDPFTNHYFLDVNGSVFSQILDFLRYRELVLPDRFDQLPLLKKLAEHFEIEAMVKELRRLTDVEGSEEETESEENHSVNLKQAKPHRRKRRSKKRDNKNKVSGRGEENEEPETEDESNMNSLVNSKAAGALRETETETVGVLGERNAVDGMIVNTKVNAVIVHCEIGNFNCIDIYSHENLTLRDPIPGQPNLTSQCATFGTHLEYHVSSSNSDNATTGLHFVTQLLEQGYYLSSVALLETEYNEIREFVLTKA